MRFLSYRAPSWMAPSLVVLPLLGALVSPAVLAAPVDSDNDGILDNLDAFPCDADKASVTFIPNSTDHGTLIFEDLWPARGDFDFNDVVVAFQEHVYKNAAGQVTSMRVSLRPLAAGALDQNGLAFHLPLPRGSVASVQRKLGNTTTTIAPDAGESEVVITLLDNIRDAFPGAPSTFINTDDTLPGVNSSVIELTINFATPVNLSLSQAPFDIYIFRNGNPAHQIHLPQYAGTDRMNTLLFGLDDDRSTTGRSFVDDRGVPFVLQLPTSAPHPREGRRIEALFPDVVDFAASGGSRNSDFFLRPQNSNAFVRGTNLVTRPAPAALPDLVALDSCINSVFPNNDLIDVVQGQALTFNGSLLTQNDNDAAGALPLRVVAVSNAVGGTATVSGSLVTFTPSVTAGQPASFTYTAENSRGQRSDANVNVNVLPLPPLQALMVDNSTDFNRLTASTFNPPTPQDIFNKWQRFSHGSCDSSASIRNNTVPGCAAELTSWSFDTTLNSVVSNTNSTSYIGFVSDEPLENYTMEATLTSHPDAGDNDTIGVVLAFASEGTPGTAGYREFTLSALRSRNDQPFDDVQGVATHWAVAYNFMQLDEKLIADGTSTVVHSNGNIWNLAATQTRLRVVRQGDIITVSASQFGSTTIDPATTLTIDLNSQPELAKFRGARPYGLSALSQQFSRYTNFVVEGGLNQTLIFDMTTPPGRVLDYVSASDTWVQRAGVTPVSVLGCPRRIIRPNINTITPALQRQIFDLSCNGTVTKVDDPTVTTCKTILDDGLSVGSGNYTIDPDGEGGLDPFVVFCDMTTEGGGWTRISYTADLAFNRYFTSDKIGNKLPTDFTLALSKAQIFAIQQASTEGKQRYVGLCDGVIHYFYTSGNEFSYAFGFTFLDGTSTPSMLASYSPFNITVVQDGCKSNGGEGGTLAKATIFDIRSISVPVVSVTTRDSGDAGEKFGSPLTQNPAFLR